ncbi:MAG: zinc ribbon domain-containing protein [Clostridia bacterium]
MGKMVKCASCGNEIAKSAKTCPGCGAKNKKPIYKKWWFWAIVVVVIIAIGTSGGNDNKTTNTTVDTENATSAAEDVIEYEAVNLGMMIKDLKNNAMKAESEYQDKYVEVKGRINNFDSDGKYISIKPTNASEWDFDTAMCYIKNDDQKTFLLEKSVGDVVTVKGKVKSIGEIIGYQIDIDEIG